MTNKEYKIPTLIQEKAIPVALSGRDILGIAQIGTDKTAAFAIPVIQLLDKQLPNEKKKVIKTLILIPTRELAIQIEDSLRDYVKYDEADRMLDMGFMHDIKRLLPMLPKNKQTLFFSTMMPLTIANLSKFILYNPVRVDVTRASSVICAIEQCLFLVEKPQKNDLLFTILKKKLHKSALAFSRTKHGADRIARILNRKGIGCESIHNDKSQGSRERSLSNFKSGKTRVIIATDIAARGIGISNLELVINYDLPDMAETYIHRIERASDRNGTVLSFYSQKDHTMVKDIQKFTEKQLSVLSA